MRRFEDAKPKRKRVKDDIDFLTDAKDSLAVDTTEVDQLIQDYFMLLHKKQVQEKQLGELAEQISELETKSIPDALAAIGRAKHHLRDGTTLEVAAFTVANVKKEGVDDLHEWLRKNGHNDLIKSSVVLAFGRGEFDKAKKLKSYLQKEHLPFESKEGVAYQTLQAFVREQLAAGTILPQNIFNLFHGRTIKIKRPKEKSNGKA